MAQAKILRCLLCGLAISLPMLPGTALAHGGGGGTAIIGGYQVTLAFTEPARAGENLFHVQILDGMGMPSRGAQVIISAVSAEGAQPHQGSMEGMAGMEGMAEMKGSANEISGTDGRHGMSHAPAAVPVRVSANEAEGEYVGAIAFSAAGHWLVNTHVSINGQMLMVDFPLEVEGGSSDYAIAILVTFAGLNAVIIWAASFAKRKPVLPKPTVESI
jgi:hypothetical protein